MGVPFAEVGRPFLCPLTGDRAVLLWERDPERPARLWLRVGGPKPGSGLFLALARFRLAMAAGSLDATVVRQAPAATLSAWWSRLAHEAGLTSLAAADWRASKLAAARGLSHDAVKAAHGFDLLAGLRRQAGFPGSWAGTPYAIRFAGPWAGLTEWKARRALASLRESGVLILAGAHEATLPHGVRVPAPLYGVGIDPTRGSS